MKIKFSMRSRALCLGVPEPTKWLAAQSTAHTLRLGKLALTKEK